MHKIKNKKQKVKSKSTSRATIFFRIVMLFLLTGSTVCAQTQTANPNNIDQIIAWGNDGVTKQINFPEGTFNFPKTISLSNNKLILIGSGMTKTFLNLTAESNTLIDAVGSGFTIKNLTLDGGKKQKTFANPIFRFNKSSGHYFENVQFRNSKYNGIGAINGYATDDLVLKSCIFSNIESMPLQIFNRNTNLRGGAVIVSVAKIWIDGCTFKEGYQTGISSDNGNDRKDNGNGIGRRYTESTSLNGTTIENCTFEKSKQFHIALVQSKDVIIKNNTFAGMTDDAGGGCQAIHMEQFTENIEIYNNIFSMASTVSQSYNYIHVNGTEGHKRVTQAQASNTYPTWTYNVNGGDERRADTQCASTGNINKDCKRDVHAYGPRNIYIAGNTFNQSSKIQEYLSVDEGENIQIGTKKGGAVVLNNFIGGNASSKKITFGGMDEGTGNVLIRAGQNIVQSNLDIKDVKFDLPAIRLKKPIVVENNASKEVQEISKLKFHQSPEDNNIVLEENKGTLTISSTSGKTVKVVKVNHEDGGTVSLEGLSSGIYFLSLETPDGLRKIEKLIILGTK